MVSGTNTLALGLQFLRIRWGLFGLELFQHAVLQTTSVRFRGWVDAFIWPCSPGGIPEQFMQFGTQLYPAAIRKCLEKEVQCCSRVHVTC